MISTNKEKLFSASFKQSQEIVPNLYTSKPFLFDLGDSDSPSMWKRTTMILPVLFFVTFLGAFGIVLPDYAKENLASNPKIMSNEVFHGMVHFDFMKSPTIVLIIFFLIIAIINIFPKKNYAIQRVYGVMMLDTLLLLTYVGIMPPLLGISLGASGKLGFTLIVLQGLIFFYTNIKKKTDEIKQKMYKTTIEKSVTNWTKYNKWLFLGTFLLVVANMYFFHIEMGETTPGTYDILWSFLGVVYFGIVEFFVKLTMELLVSTFYFVKYAEEYRALWNLTDEQWYGEKKAKRIAKDK